MTLCPIALAAGCRKCPLVGVCPLKGVIGDYRKEEPKSGRPASRAKGGGKKPGR